MRYEFGLFRLDSERLILFRDGTPVPVAPKVLHTLLLLVENSGRVVHKEELLRSVWLGVNVQETNLTQSIFALRRILGEKPKDHDFIVTVPGKGYRFVAPVTRRPLVNGLAPESGPTTDPPSHPLRPYYLGGTMALVLFLLASGYVRFQKTSPSFLFSSTPLTSYLGSQLCPSFAPDGERVAFAWDSERQGNFNIYVKQVGVALPLRLTRDPEPDISPAWSPDGRTISFLHVIAQGKGEVTLISAIAPGSVRKLTTITIPPESYFRLRFTAWSPDGKWIALSDGPHFTSVMSLVLLSVETGERRRVTSPPSGYDDFSPAFSPDMSRVAFVRYSSFGASAGDLYFLRLSEDLKPVGEPERLTFYNGQIASPVWTTDGRSILFVRHEVAGTPSLWRVRIGRDRQIEPLLIPADSSYTLALSPRGNRIVYTRDSENVNIWAAELGRNHRIRSIRPHITSPWSESNPQFSPDGRRITYQSLQSGRLEIWVCDRDGSHSRQLTQLGAVVSGFARWSPDGKKIAFHSRPQSLAGVYLVDVDGSKPECLTGDTGSNISPSWSHDGRWIYFASRRTGENHIWRMPATGGTATPIGEHSGWCPLESKDGRFLYYATMSGSALRAVPLSGGPEKELLSGLAGDGSSYAPATDGIYFIRVVSHDRKQELAFFDFASHRITTVAEISRPVFLGLALSPTEDLILYSQVDRQVSNLMLVENFR